jgi:hypothetical protein
MLLILRLNAYLRKALSKANGGLILIRNWNHVHSSPIQSILKTWKVRLP